MLMTILVMIVIMSLTMIGGGLLFIKRPPKEINSVIGYRTTMSRKNKETWDFAHQYSGQVWIKSGILNGVIASILAVALQGFNHYNQLMVALIYIQLVVLLLVIPLTEIALRKKFDQNGNRK
jgi:uncharacterized membrane protein